MGRAPQGQCSGSSLLPLVAVGRDSLVDRSKGYTSSRRDGQEENSVDRLDAICLGNVDGFASPDHVEVGNLLKRFFYVSLIGQDTSDSPDGQPEIPEIPEIAQDPTEPAYYWACV
jgi:hypothetical protein